MLEEATVLPMIMPEFFTGIRRPVKVRARGYVQQSLHIATAANAAVCWPQAFCSRPPTLQLAAVRMPCAHASGLGPGPGAPNASRPGRSL